jgi:hypothetical protein
MVIKVRDNKSRTLIQEDSSPYKQRQQRLLSLSLSLSLFLLPQPLLFLSTISEHSGKVTTVCQSGREHSSDHQEANGLAFDTLT